jgi:hypothetical protein
MKLSNVTLKEKNNNYYTNKNLPKKLLSKKATGHGI